VSEQGDDWWFKQQLVMMPQTDAQLKQQMNQSSLTCAACIDIHLVVFPALKIKRWPFQISKDGIDHALSAYIYYG
jgi:hypothetical protein